VVNTVDDRENQKGSWYKAHEKESQLLQDILHTTKRDGSGLERKATKKKGEKNMKVDPERSGKMTGEGRGQDTQMGGHNKIGEEGGWERVHIQLCEREGGGGGTQINPF